MIYNSNCTENESKDSYFITKEFNLLLTTRNAVIESLDPLKESDEFATPLVNDLPTPHPKIATGHRLSPRVSLKELEKIINTKISDALNPYLIKFESLSKKYEKLLDEQEIYMKDNSIIMNGNIVLKEKAKEMDVSENTIAKMQKEVDFLKLELTNKNEVIKILTQQIHKTTVNTTAINSNHHEASQSTMNKHNNNETLKKSITILGDSTLKQVKAKNIRKNCKNLPKVFVKSFPGATIQQMHHYMIPSLDFKPELVILHCGTNDLRSEKSAETIAKDVIELAKAARCEDNEILISNIITRGDKYKNKAMAVNKSLKTLCQQNSFEYINNANLNEKHHLSTDGIHLNFKGSFTLGTNFSNAINA